jgi:Flp pilus assembly protein TadG
MKKIFYKKKNGQTLVEWALVLPVLLLMILGVMDLGRAVYYNSVVYNAAREGARYGIIHPCDNGGVESEVGKRAVATTISTISITWNTDLKPDPKQDPNKCDDSTKPYPKSITLVVTSNFAPVTPFVGPVTLSSTSTMRVER